MLLPDALDILKTRLEAIDGLTVTTDPAVTVTPPMALIDATRMDYNESFTRGAALLEFSVTVFVSQADSAEGVFEAREYLSGYGDKSVRAAIETQPSGGDAFLKKVVVDTGERGETSNFIVANFAGRAHVPGEVAT